MNAQEKGRQVGFSVKLGYRSLSREQFEKLAQRHAARSYATEKKQASFVIGFMENYHEPHAKDCTCDECKRVHTDITLY